MMRQHSCNKAPQLWSARSRREINFTSSPSGSDFLLGWNIHFLAKVLVKDVCVRCNRERRPKFPDWALKALNVGLRSLFSCRTGWTANTYIFHQYFDLKWTFQPKRKWQDLKVDPKSGNFRVEASNLPNSSIEGSRYPAYHQVIVPLD